MLAEAARSGDIEAARRLLHDVRVCSRLGQMKERVRQQLNEPPDKSDTAEEIGKQEQRLERRDSGANPCCQSLSEVVHLGQVSRTVLLPRTSTIARIDVSRCAARRWQCARLGLKARGARSSPRRRHRTAANPVAKSRAQPV